MTRARDVADAGHSTTATTADTISQKTSINLSGTYSTHQLLVADAYALTGDATVNDNLILGKLSDDGTDTVLEGSHTLQGTGQLEAGYVTSSGIGSVDGMTGELGSAITGSPTLNLGNTTGTLGSGIFPVGHVLNVTSRPTRLQTHVTGGTYTGSDCYHYITTTAGNSVLVSAYCPLNLYTGSVAVDSASMALQIFYSADGSSYAFMSVGDGTDKAHGVSNFNYSGNLQAHWTHSSSQTIQFLHTPASGTTHYYKVYIKYNGHTGTGHAAIMNPDGNYWGGMTLMEIKA